MNISAPTFPDRIRYYLIHLNSGNREYIFNPRGWDEDDKTISRDKTFFGIARKTSDSLNFLKGERFDPITKEFVKGGFDFILSVRNIGVNEDLVIVREERDNTTNVFKERYRSELDLTTLTQNFTDDNEQYCSLKSSDAGLDSILKARKSENMEITRKFALDDPLEENELVDIQTDIVELRGRKIELVNKAFISGDQTILIQDETMKTPLTDLEYSSEPAFKSITSVDTYSGRSFFNGSDTSYASLVSALTLNYSFEVQSSTFGSVTFDLVLLDETNGTTSVKRVFSAMDVGDIKTGSITMQLSLPKNTGWSLLMRPLDQNSTLIFREWTMFLKLEQEKDPTTTKAYSYKAAFDKYVELMTGRSELIRSDFLDTTDKNFFITDGSLVRNIPVTSDSPNARIHQLETSFKDIYESLDASWCMGVGIEREGFKEFIRIEQREYFFQPHVVLELGELNDIERNVASEFSYSGIEIGYDGEAKIEGIQGLDKTNGKVNRITKITRQENVYKKLSKFQTDDYPREIQRRKQFIESPTEDVKYDDTKMILDCFDPSSGFTVTLIDNNLHQKGVIFNTNAWPSFLFVQFSTTPANDAITIGANLSETLDNALIYLTTVDFYKDYFDYEITSSEIIGKAKLPFYWIEMEAENLLGSVSWEINTTMNDESDRTLKQRTSLDDFEALPTGVYDPEGMTNGRWTPLAMTLRHGSWIRAGISDYLDSQLSFGSSNSNTQLTGTLRNDNNYPYLKGIPYSESSNINVSDLEGNYYYFEWVKGTHVVSQETMDVLEGYSTFDGKKIKNMYCLCSFVNKDNERELGYIFSVKPNKEGQWEFLSLKKRI